MQLKKGALIDFPGPLRAICEASGFLCYIKVMMRCSLDGSIPSDFHVNLIYDRYYWTRRA